MNRRKIQGSSSPTELGVCRFCLPKKKCTPRKLNGEAKTPQKLLKGPQKEAGRSSKKIIFQG